MASLLQRCVSSIAFLRQRPTAEGERALNVQPPPNAQPSINLEEEEEEEQEDGASDITCIEGAADAEDVDDEDSDEPLFKVKPILPATNQAYISSQPEATDNASGGSQSQGENTGKSANLNPPSPFSDTDDQPIVGFYTHVATESNCSITTSDQTELVRPDTSGSDFMT